MKNNDLKINKRSRWPNTVQFCKLKVMLKHFLSLLGLENMFCHNFFFFFFATNCAKDSPGDLLFLTSAFASAT